VDRLAEDLGKRLEDGLRQVQDSLKHLNQSPAIVVVNPPAAPPPDWHQAVDPATVVSSATVFLLLLLLIGCWLLRRYRPEAWKGCKAVAVRVLKVIALPASWLLTKAAGLLQQFHQTPQAVQTQV
jgi:hypothetical protein